MKIISKNVCLNQCETGSNLSLFSPRLFVANLSYTVDERKLREVFRLAGRVVMVELNRDKEVNTLKHFNI